MIDTTEKPAVAQSQMRSSRAQRGESQEGQDDGQFRQLADSMPQLAWMADPTGWLYWYNQRWLDYTGAPFADLEGWGWQEVHHPDHIDRVMTNWMMALEKGEDWEDTFPLRGRNGEYRWFLSRAFPIRDANGRILRWFGTNTDITERLQAEEALRVSEAFSRSVLENSPDCVKVLDAAGRLLSMNEEGRKAMEIEDLSVYLHRPWQEFWPEQERPKAQRAFQEALAGKSSRFEGFCSTATGKEKWWEVILTPIDTQEADVKILCISRDMTERKRIETELQNALSSAQEARERAIDANRRKDDFLANMSHELRTPLNAIVGLGHILAKSQPLTDKQRACIETLQTSSDSLLALINDLLDIARIESESIQLENVEFNLRETLAEIVSVCSVKANEKHIPLMLHYDSRLAEEFIGDPHRLKQIVMNLISNAVKFTEHGRVDIRAEMMQDINGLSEISIRVNDTGIGIEPQKLGMVFDKFSQGDTSITRRYGGTGLGLAISRTLARLMGGDITVTSQRGKGSCFTLAVPLVRKAVPEAHASGFVAPQGAFGKMPRVLIVEDYMPNLLVARTYLELFGFRYDTASSGEEALEKIRASAPYDAVMMDVQMSGMDGWSTTRAIRQWERASGRPPVPILGTTTYALKGDREKCLEAGMSDYLSKPFTPEVLCEKIRSFVQETAAA